MADAPAWYIHAYGNEVHEAFQRKGSMLKNIVRRKSKFKGKSTNFYTYGTGSVGQKTRFGTVPMTNPGRGRVDCYTETWYSGGMVDTEDMKLMEVDERKYLANAQAYALGRKVDDIVILRALSLTPNQMPATEGALAYLRGSKQATGSNPVTDDTHINGLLNAPGNKSQAFGMSPLKLLELGERFSFREVPKEDRYLLIGPHQWNEMLRYPEFVNADFVGDNLPYKGGDIKAKSYNGWKIIEFTGLPITMAEAVSGNRYRSCFAFQKSAAGFAMNGGIETTVSYQAMNDAWLQMSKFSAGGVLIDGNGIDEILCLENTDLNPYINEPLGVKITSSN